MNDPFWGYEHSGFFEFWNNKNFVNIKKEDDNRIVLSVDDGTNNPVVRIKMTTEDFRLFLKYGQKFIDQPITRL
jgi:hypothetical protein